MHVIDPAFGSSDMQASAVEVDLIPPQATYFRRTKPMSVCDQDHRGVPVPIAGTLARSILEPLDLFFGQIFPGPEFGIRGSARNCPVCDG
jgi:hypothetical protein